MYELLFSKSAAKEFEGLTKPVQEKIVAALFGLASAPYDCRQVKKLSGDQGYRLRVGSFRVIYFIDSTAMTITIVAVGDRKDIYK